MIIADWKTKYTYQKIILSLLETTVNIVFECEYLFQEILLCIKYYNQFLSNNL